MEVEVQRVVRLLRPQPRGEQARRLRRHDGAVLTVPGPRLYYADRKRNQVNASLSHYAEGFGKHDLKFGVEIERSKVRSAMGIGGL